MRCLILILPFLCFLAGCGNQARHVWLAPQAPSLGMRNVIIRLVDSVGNRMKWTGPASQLTAEVNGQSVRMKYDRENDFWWCSVGERDVVKVQMLRKLSDVMYAEIGPDSSDVEDHETEYSVVIKPFPQEYVPRHGGEWRLGAMPASFVRVYCQDTSMIASLNQLLEHLSLRRLSARELYVMGVDDAMHPWYDSLRGTNDWVVIKKEGGDFDRLDSPELRALRAHPSTGSGVILKFGSRYPVSYSSRITLKYSKERNKDDIDSILRGMSASVEEYGEVKGYGFFYIVSVNQGVGRGLYEVGKAIADSTSASTFSYTDFTDDSIGE